MTKVKEALDMAMSRFDQIMAPSAGLLSRKGIATCVACDRPLASKKRAKDIYDMQPVDMGYDNLGPPKALGQDNVSVELQSTESSMMPMPTRVVRPANSVTRIPGSLVGANDLTTDDQSDDLGSKSVSLGE